MQVNALYQLLEKTDKMASAVPVLMDRLLALKALHTDVGTFSESLSSLTNEQGRLQESVKTMQQVAERVCIS